MKRNIGKRDAFVRIILSAVIAVTGFYYSKWWGFLAFVPLLTAYFSFCPIYKAFGISSSKSNAKVSAA